MDPSNIVSAGKWIGSMLLEEAKFLEGVEDKADELVNYLAYMQELLQGVDLAKVLAKEGDGDGQHQLFIEKIRKLAFQAEDVIDAYISSNANKNKNMNPLEKCSCIANWWIIIANCWQIHQFGMEIKAILKGIQDANNQLVTFQAVRPNNINANTNENHNRESCEDKEEDIDVVGLDDPIKLLVKELVDEGKQSRRIMGIVGTGGAGKTTLARQLYNHSTIMNHFQLRSWISVSQQRERNDLLIEILNNTRGIPENERESIKQCKHKELRKKIREFLKWKKYLIVVDDIWDQDAWDTIRLALPFKEGSSKIILTTRNKDIPNYTNLKYLTHEPEKLTEKESWELFCKYVFSGGSSSMEFHQKLGKEMVKRCNGLPLAIVAIAGVLRVKHESYEWETVNKAYNDYILRAKVGPDYGVVDKMIALSYLDLPSYLKPCFLYLSIFPEDFVIKTGMLIRLWIAEGLVTKDNQLGHETLEDVGLKNVEELTRRCILQVVRRNYEGKVKECRIHDLMRDFCIERAKGQKFLEVLNPTEESTKERIMESRRVVQHISGSFSIHVLYVRSVAIFGTRWVNGPALDPSSCKSFWDSKLWDLTLLRVLILWGLQEGASLEEVCKLRHLRYLSLGASFVIELPESFGNLRSLTTFHAANVKVPNTLWKLEKLKHFMLTEDGHIPMDALRVDTLSNLQTLWGVIGENWLLKDIAKLSSTVQKLGITNIENEEVIKAVMQQCPSIRQDCLIKLKLEWRGCATVLSSTMNLLGNCQNLRKLILFGRIRCEPCQQLKLFPPNLCELELRYTSFEESATLDILGNLCSLKYLILGMDSYTGVEWTCKANSFPQLQDLTLNFLFNLAEWKIEDGALPQLKRLRIFNCSNLKEAPQGSGYVKKLQYLEFSNMPDDFMRKWKAEKTKTKNMGVLNTKASTPIAC